MDDSPPPQPPAHVIPLAWQKTKRGELIEGMKDRGKFLMLQGNEAPQQYIPLQGKRLLILTGIKNFLSC
jgi:hypothetical protein